MRKGFSLIELLVVMVILAAIGNILNGVFVTAVSDIPRSYRTVQANTTLLHLAAQIEADVETAKALPAAFGDFEQSDTVLLIESSHGLICYQKDETGIRRFVLDEGGPRSDDTIWSPPNARVNWSICQKDAAAYAVELTSCIEFKSQKQMAAAHIYFVGATSEAVK
jgi:prepilin-type N-terminal cleavage/methylation domain-containing protein